MQHFIIFSVNIPMGTHVDNEEIKKTIQEVLDGNVNAFSGIVDQYKKLVAHIVFRMIYDPSDREDLCQDVFIKVYQNLSNFRFESKVSTWISKIAYNSCINYLNKRKTKYVGDGTRDLESIPSTTTGPGHFTEDEDRMIRIHAEIRNLPPPYRAIITLYHLEEMSYHDIAEVMNLPEGTVKSYLYRARQQLKEKLINKYKFQDIS
ncbi:MAG: sigma-70 family RNA polymerase sigma factor [bacterium]|nr:MAG: sigma-70 family RNA polymerase sigma factor [bacterium]